MIVLGTLVYATSSSAPFVFDDTFYIEHNEDIRQFWPPNWTSGDTAITGQPLTAFARGGRSTRHALHASHERHRGSDRRSHGDYSGSCESRRAEPTHPSEVISFGRRSG